MNKPKSIFILPENMRAKIYSPDAEVRIREITENDGQCYGAKDILAEAEKLADVEIAFSGWGSPVLDEELLQALPKLGAYLYGAGSVRNLVTEAFWARNIRLTSAYTANAVPVAEYTVASIIFALKCAWTKNHELKRGVVNREHVPGVYHGSRVGVISLGAIGRLVCERLSHFDLDVVAYDPFASDEVFEKLSVGRADSLEELFSTCSVVTLHAPRLPETEGMINADLLGRLPQNATFINTSRGAIVDEPALIEILQKRPDLFAVIDVITDEKTYTSTPLVNLPNVFLTPHIAGSGGRECHRLGDMALEECRRYIAGAPAVVPVTQENIVRMA